MLRCCVSKSVVNAIEENTAAMANGAPVHGLLAFASFATANTGVINGIPINVEIPLTSASMPCSSPCSVSDPRWDISAVMTVFVTAHKADNGESIKAMTPELTVVSVTNPATPAVKPNMAVFNSPSLSTSTRTRADRKIPA